MPKFVEVCPFDHNPCEHVGDCDDILSLAAGFDCVEGESCSRAFVKVREK